jgi:hypothetical protein
MATGARNTAAAKNSGGQRKHQAFDPVLKHAPFQRRPVRVAGGLWGRRGLLGDTRVPLSQPGVAVVERCGGRNELETSCDALIIGKVACNGGRDLDVLVGGTVDQLFSELGLDIRR